MNPLLKAILANVPEFAQLYAKADSSAAELLSVRNKGAKSSFVVKNSDDGPAEIQIFSEIGYDYWSDEGCGAEDYSKALNSIPAGKPVNVMINSPGGNLWDGLAIAALNEARGNVTCVVVGVAASAASVIAVKCLKTVMAPSATMMIHNAMSVCMGNQYDMEQTRECLAVHDKVLADIYAKKSGKPQAQFVSAMKAETWYTADAAKETGLCDEINAQIAPKNVAFNFAQFRNVPEALRKEGNKSPASGQPQLADLTNTMDKAKILAVLKGWGVTPPDNATEEQLLALINAGKPAPAAPAPALKAAADAKADDMASIARELEAMRAERKRDHDARVTSVIDKAVSELRIPTNSRDAWLARAKADEDVLALIPATAPSRQEPVGIEVVEADSRNILAEFEQCNEATTALLRGNRITPQTLRNEAVRKANHYRKHEAKITEVMNTNTMPAELQRQVIFQNMVREFAKRILPIRVFSTVFENVPLQGTDKVNVPFYDLDATAGTAWVAATGYVAGNTTTGMREITINKRQYQGASFTSSEIARQPFLNMNQLMMMKAEKLAYDTFQDILSVVTLANYGAAAITKASNLFTSDDLADLKNACKLWPSAGRSLLVDSGIDTAFLKDVTFKYALNAASDSVVRGADLGPRVYGFQYLENPNIPANGQNLTGFAVFQSAILFASSPIAPAEDVIRAGTSYELMVDPGTGVALEYRAFGSNNLDTSNRFIECNYGYAKGVASALKRIVSA